MCIESVNGNQAWTNISAWGQQSAGQVRSHREDGHEGHGHTHHAGHSGRGGHGGQGGLIRGIMQTLNQLGWGAQTSGTDPASAPAPTNAVNAVSVSIEITTINISSTTVAGAQDAASAGANTGTNTATGSAAPADSTASADSQAAGTTSGGASTPAVSATADADGDDDGCGSCGNLSPKQALHAFMHSLFKALKEAVSQANGTAGGSQASPSSTAAKAYGNNITTGLNDLIQGLGSNDPAAPTNPTLDKLKTDFQNLIDSLGLNNDTTAAAGDTSSGAQASLLSFLNALAANLGGGQDTTGSNGAAVGGIVNAAM